MTIKNRKQAQSKNTPSEILMQLASSNIAIVRQYVASNPNTPLERLETEILKKLAQEFPRQIVANPIFDIPG